MRILFVCLGNICRSPTAEGVMRHVLREEGWDDRVEIASAGLGDWHVGEPPDARATAAAQRRGIALEGAARQVTRADFRDYDLLLAMDEQNRAALARLAPDDDARRKVRLLREFDPRASPDDRDVPDPYWSGEDGFDHVFAVVEASCRGLLDWLRAEGRA